MDRRFEGGARVFSGIILGTFGFAGALIADVVKTPITLIRDGTADLSVTRTVLDEAGSQLRTGARQLVGG